MHREHKTEIFEETRRTASDVDGDTGRLWRASANTCADCCTAQTAETESRVQLLCVDVLRTEHTSRGSCVADERQTKQTREKQ